MPIARQSEHPIALIPPKTLGKSSGTWARKPRLEAMEAARLAEDKRLARAFGEALDGAGWSNVMAAAAMGLTESTVRDLRTRKARILGVHLAKLPAHIVVAMFDGFHRVTTPETLRATVANDNDGTG